MNSVIITKTFQEMPYCEREILRYAQCRDENTETVALMHDCIKEARTAISYRVCYRELQLEVRGDVCDFGYFTLKSAGLSKNLSGCEKVILMAANLGTGLDRLISKYGHLLPSRALMLSAIGSERIEALCDVFCREAAKQTGMHLRPRFSPGYGDLSLSAQMEIFAVLDCEKHIGLYLNESLMMSPSKSVTAFAGLSDKPYAENKNKCSLCNKKDCVYRGTL